MLFGRAMNWKSYVFPGGHPPAALTTGLVVFLTAIYLLSFIFALREDLSLAPESLFKLQMSRLSLYPLIHLSLPHLLFNVLAIWAPLNLFEETHGTVYTGVFLNLSALFAGILYCLLGKLLYPEALVAGASGWCFTLFAYYSFKESQIRPRTRIFRTDYSIPTLYTPLVLLVAIAVVIPGSSFWGHFFGLCVGYAIGYKESWFNKITPPGWIITKIEKSLDGLIRLIPWGIKYYRDEDIDRTKDYEPLMSTETPLPLHNDNSGTVLGTA